MAQLGLLGELIGVAVGRLDEQVERAVRLGALVAHLTQAVVQQVAVLVVGHQVGALLGAQLDDLLHQRGGADMAHDAGGAGDGGIHRVAVVCEAGDVHIADTLAGQGQGLGVGIADDGVLVQAGDEGDLHAAVDQLTVGLIGNDVDGMAVFLALALQQGSQTLQGLLGIHNAGGIIGGVDDNTLGVLRDALFHLVQMDLECLGVGGNHHQLAAVGVDEGAILGEEGGHCHDLAVGVHDQGLDDGDQRGSSAAGEEQLAGFHIQAEALGQILGHGGTGGIEAGSHGIAVQLDGIHLVHELLDGLVDLLGGGNAGIAQRIVIHLVRADLGGLLQTVGKQLADHRGRRTQIVVFLIDHNIISSFTLLYYVHAAARQMNHLHDRLHRANCQAIVNLTR